MTRPTARLRRHSRWPIALAACLAIGSLPGPIVASGPNDPSFGVEASASVELGPTTALRAGSVERTSVDLRATYTVDLAVQYRARRIRLVSTAQITNTSGRAIDRVELNTVAARLGAMTLDRVTVNGRIRTANVSDQTIVVPLGGILDPGASVSVQVIYHATLRTTTGGSDWFFTKSDGVIDLYRAIPWVSLRHPFDRPNFGDPFVTPSSPRVTLKLTTDRPLVAALDATRTSVSSDGRVQTFVAANVRDLPISLAPDFHVARGNVGNVSILVYARPDRATSNILADAERSVRQMTPLLGPYPWPRLVFVATPGGASMEGPGTVWLPPGIPSVDIAYNVAHETAHSWTPGLVGSDQWADPFADEALADMVARLTLGLERASRCAAGRFDRPITAYSNACYYEVIYIQGGNWLNDLRLRMGSATYWAAIRGYLTAHRFGLGGSRALLDALDRATPLNVAALAKSRFPSLY